MSEATPSTGAGGGWLGALSSFVNEAQKSLNSLMGWEDLEVVEPTAGGAVRGTASDERKAFFSAAGLNMSDFLGKDVTSLMSVPVFIMEPVSMLQKMGEIMEYSALLDLANDEEDQYQRLALVVGFCMGPFGAVERTWKPFNPILGETFEMQSGEGVQYVAEQVSHHPPIGAACASNGAFEYELLSSPKTKFLGNSVEVYPVGRTRIRLKKTGELFWHRPPNAKAHNILLGMVWVDVAGSFTVANAATGDRCELQFQPCGWFGEGRYEVEGYIIAADDTRKYRLTGRWNSHLDMVACDAEGAAVKGATMQRIWAASGKPKAAGKWGFGAFAARLNACVGMPAPLATDSRRRPDRAALAAGDNSKSQLLKHEVEEMQRAEQRQRAAQGDVWLPRWFDPVPAPALADGSAASSSAGAAEEPQIFDGEWPLQDLPAWKWNGQYHQLPQAATVTAEAEVLGQGFNPWCYPNLHDGCDAMPKTLPAPPQ